MKKAFIILVCSMFMLISMKAQRDTSKIMNEISISGFKAMNGIGHMPDVEEGIIYAGKKNEVILVDSLDANKAINNTRQILGRIPGLNIVETESGGFTANGIATRGLNPVQSTEMNTRQNGYNVSADAYGYNEAYYLPPMEAVSRIEMLRGAAALQFGGQFGGMVNYVLKEAPANKVFEFNTSQTVGSFGLFNSFNSVGGTYKKFSYYAFLQYRNLNGYRPNSQQWQLSGFGKLNYRVSQKVSIGVEYSLLRNRLQMPGGLTDSLFEASPRISMRSRNWLKTPWNIVAATLEYHPSENASLHFKTAYLLSNRSLVWRNEDGGPEALDIIDTATNQFVPREVGKQDMQSINSELRFSQNYGIKNQVSVLSAGVRVAYASFLKKGGGKGSTNSDFDLSIVGSWEYDFKFTTLNVAPFIENIFRIGNKFSITPGIRLEYLKSTSYGYKIKSGVVLNTNENRTRVFPLLGVGLELKPTSKTSIYSNFSQAYKPIEYGQLQPFGITSKIDPNLKDAKGYSADLGFRGTIKNFFKFDIGAFYMAYNNRIGVVSLTDPVTGAAYSYRTNIANSMHLGAETYLEFNILKCVNPKSKCGLSLFNSFAYINAKYTSGKYKGKRVEAAAEYINRAGIIFSNKHFSTTLQCSYVGDAYGDASNVKRSNDAIGGYIPAYTVLDFSATYKLKNYAIKAGINNVTNTSYFTRRTDEYPGPGIIPSVGRSIYVGINAQF